MHGSRDIGWRERGDIRQVLLLEISLRAPNKMKHVCVTARIGSDTKRGAAHIENMSKLRDKVSARIYL
jgi:hypothetical protein